MPELNGRAGPPICNITDTTIASPTVILTEGSSAQVWVTWNEPFNATTSTITGAAGGGGGTIQISNSGQTVRIWQSWTTSYTSGGSGTIATLATIEPTTASITSATSGDIWIRWNEGIGTLPQVAISDEEYQARQREYERQRQEQQARWAAEQAEQAKAKERAEVILAETLSEAQKAELADKKYFTLTKIDSKTGERRNYRIHRGRSHNVEQVDEQGKKVQRFCMHPIIHCPEADTMLAQMLWLQSREDEFRRVANRS